MVNSSSENVFEALEFIASAEVPPTLVMIARAQGIPTSTAFRIVSTLQNAGFIQLSDRGNGYILGGAGQYLAQALFNRFKIRRVAYPFLQQLALMTGETCCLTVPIGWYCVRIAVARGTNEVVLSPALGEIIPLGGNLASKAILAFLPNDTLSAYFRWHKTMFMQTVDRALLKELTASRKRGFASEASASQSEKKSIAFPILLDNRAIASISIEGPVLDESTEKCAELVQWVDVCKRIEALVGQQPKLFRNPFDHLDPDAIVLSDVHKNTKIRFE